jgi:hypothetical protein
MTSEALRLRLLGVGLGDLLRQALRDGRQVQLVASDHRRRSRLAAPYPVPGGVGGHAAALHTVESACHQGVRRMVQAHIGWPTIRALDAGEPLPYGEAGREGTEYTL